MRSSLPRLVRIARWLWLVSVVVFIAAFLSRRYEAFLAAIGNVRLELLLVSALLLVLSKVLLTLNMQLALKMLGKNTPFGRAFLIYNWTQLSKYIPGGVWFFVGRYQAFDDEGLDFRESTRAMIVELGVLTLSASTIGILLVSLATPDLLGSMLHSWHIDLHLGTGLSLLLLPFIGVAAGIAWASYIRLRPSLYNVLQQVSLQIPIWLALGASFGVVAMPLGGPESPLFFVGLYAIAHISGILVPLAPGGIGIREAVAVLGLSPWLGLDGALSVSLIHRMLYLTVEVLLVLFHQIIRLLLRLVPAWKRTP